MGALTKAEMAERLYEELGLNKREAKELVELGPAAWHLPPRVGAGRWPGHAARTGHCDAPR